MLEKILNVIFRRKTLNSILFILVAATIRELAALGASEEVIEFCNKIQEQNPDNFLYYISIVIEFIFGKGSYITLGILLILIFLFAFLKTKENSQGKTKPILEINLIPNGKGNESQVLPSSKTPRNKDGMPVMQVGNKTGRQELYWKYKVKVINNSTATAFSPELFVDKSFSNINFIGDLDINSPIKGAESVDLKIKYKKWVDGTSQERDEIRKHTFPPEIINGFKLIIKYNLEDGLSKFRKFEFKGGKGETGNLRKISEDYVKAKIYKSIFR